MNSRVALTILAIVFVIIVFVSCGILDFGGGRVIVLIDNEYLTAGNKRVYWSQTNKDGNPVSSGGYHAYLKVDKTYCWVGFQIMKGANHIPAPPDTIALDTCFSGQKSCYGLCVSSLTYGVGDTVIIQFALPQASNIWLAIEK